MHKLLLLEVFVAFCLIGTVFSDANDFSQFLRVYNITFDKNISLGDVNVRVQSSSRLSSRLFNAPLPGGDLLVGWTDDSYVGHVSYLKKDAEKGYVLEKTVDLENRRVRGLAALNDTSFGVLAWNFTVPTNQSKMYVQKWTAMNKAGQPTMQFESVLGVNASNYPNRFDIGDSRMEVDAAGNFYAYYHVHSYNGHEGDGYYRVNSVTGEVTRIWSWGCSHSMSNLLSYHPVLNSTLSMCVTDCYPGTPGDNFKADSIGGLYTEARNLLKKMSGGCDGCVGGEIGMVAPIHDGGWAVIFNSHRKDFGKGQAACNKKDLKQDVAVAIIDEKKQLSGKIKWLTNTKENEFDPGLARYGAFCGNESCKDAGQAGQTFLIGWKSSYSRFFGVMDDSGRIISGPYNISYIDNNGTSSTVSVSWGSRDDTWRTLDDGGVAWLEVPEARKNVLRVFVMEYGEIPLNSASILNPFAAILLALFVCIMLTL